jgi:hypothetical protein
MSPIRSITAFCFLFAGILSAGAQSLPERFQFDLEEGRLIRGNQPTYGMYAFDNIDTVHIQFDQSDYWNLLLDNYEDKIELLASFSYNDIVYDSVAVRFKGQTSFFQNNTDKKSFNITLDYYVDDQEIENYSTLNLNNAFQDPTYLHEVLYLHESRKNIACAKANYVVLTVNGESWGLYVNVQQLDKQHVEEWFLDNDATRWRAESTEDSGGPGGGGPGGGGPNFGAGTSTLNYLGPDTADYTEHYTLKSADKTDPWADLVKATEVLNESSAADLVDSTFKYIDVDEALWFIATEFLFSDDDGYVYKGGMDYYVYYDVATQRLVPIEYDGNSCMEISHNWDMFYRENDTDFPLINVLLANNELRQRYLAHLRTLIAESFDADYIEAKIDHFKSKIDAYVENDPKMIYSYNDFLTEMDDLKDFFSVRKSTLESNSELAEVGLDISDVTLASNGVDGEIPDETSVADIKATVTGNPGVSKVYLYHGTGFMGHFSKTEMYDDGQHEDGSANDGVYGAEIPAYDKGEYIRYYIEAVSSNTAETRTYSPPGAEHDVYAYQVRVSDFAAENDLVINELMSSNTSVVEDANGEFDDWVELYNTGADAIDLSGYFLTDNFESLNKWTFPSGTTIPANDYLIVWLDKDTTQAGLHANFKLDKDGESLYLLNDASEIVDMVIYNAHITDRSYSRIPNGTGKFIWKEATHGTNNEVGYVSVEEIDDFIEFKVFPNPVKDILYLSLEEAGDYTVKVYTSQGHLMYQDKIEGDMGTVSVQDWAKGLYLMQIGNQVAKVIVN